MVMENQTIDLSVLPKERRSLKVEHFEDQIVTAPIAK